MSALTIATVAPDQRTDHGSAGTPAPVRLLPAPITEPHPASRVVERPGPLGSSAAATSAKQGTLTLTPDASRLALPRKDTARSKRAGVNRATGSDGSATGSAHPADDLTAQLKLWVAQFVQAAIEVTAGLRPPTQLVRWTSEDVYATLARRFTLGQRLGAAQTGRVVPRTGRIAVRSVHGRSPHAGVLEACAVITEQGRTRAVALRLELTDERWRVTALELA